MQPDTSIVDSPEDWLGCGLSPHFAHTLAALEGQLRWLVWALSRIFTIATPSSPTPCSLPSKCIREWLQSNTDTKQCPVCRSYKAEGRLKPLHASDLRPCPALDRAACEFSHLRRDLLELVSRNASAFTTHKPTKSTAGDGDRRSAEENEGSRRGNRDNTKWDTYWAEQDLTLITRHQNYHSLKENRLRPELSRVGLNSQGARRALVFRHQTYLRLGDVERDKVKIGKKAKPRQEVIEEVQKLERAHFSKVVSDAAQLDTNHPSWGKMIRSMRKATARNDYPRQERDRKVEKQNCCEARQAEGEYETTEQHAQHLGMANAKQSKDTVSIVPEQETSLSTSIRRPGNVAATQVEASEGASCAVAFQAGSRQIQAPPPSADSEIAPEEQAASCTTSREGRHVILTADASNEVEFVGLCPPPAYGTEPDPSSGTKRSSQVLPSNTLQKKQKQTTQSSVQPMQKWQCEACTVYNVSTATSCTVCGTPAQGTVHVKHFQQRQQTLLEQHQQPQT